LKQDIAVGVFGGENRAQMVGLNCNQGRNKGGKRAQCPGRQITGDVEKSKQCRKYFLQYSTVTPKIL